MKNVNDVFGHQPRRSGKLVAACYYDFFWLPCDSKEHGKRGFLAEPDIDPDLGAARKANDK